MDYLGLSFDQLDEGAVVALLRARGADAAFAAGDPDGHQLVNRGTAPAMYLEIGTRAADDTVVYPDVDLRLEKRAGQRTFVRNTGEPYE